MLTLLATKPRPLATNGRGYKWAAYKRAGSEDSQCACAVKMLIRQRVATRGLKVFGEWGRNFTLSLSPSL